MLPSRRDFSKWTSLALGGVALGDVSMLRAQEASESKARSCVFIFLFGGPSHVDLWDMKPEAPAEVRGEFQSIETAVPGIQLCEHLPLLAQQMSRLCLVRSMTHSMPVHGPACSQMYTGREYFGPPTTDEARPEDWPSVSSLVTRFGHSSGPLPPSIVLPWYSQFTGQGKRIAGQTGGRMGETYNPLLMNGDPSRSDFHLPGLELPDHLPSSRLAERVQLSDRLSAIDAGGYAQTNDPLAAHRERAFALLADARVAKAVDLRREPDAERDRYGRGKFGQSLLLARRLVEAGVSLVTVNWDDDSRDDKVSPFWDTHHDNFSQLKERLCPHFDRAMSSFLEDLDERGILETTLVVASGEFGRSPKIGQFTQNAMTQPTGRDHWPHAFTVLLAGGGVRGGQVYGRTSSTGGYVVDKPVTPADLSTTIFQHLGIDHTQEYFDHIQRIPQRLSMGTPIESLG